MSVLHDLRMRRTTLAGQLEEVDARLDALEYEPHGDLREWQRGTAAERILMFLDRHSLLDWSPAELMEGTLGGEHALRRALTRLRAAKLVVRDRHARYRAMPP